MNINLGYIHEIVMVADHAPLVNLKNLSQKERNLLNRVCYLSQNFRRNFMLRELNTQQETLEKLKNKLEAINGKRVPSNIIIAFFKFIGNKLDLRISSTKLRDEVKQTADHLAIPKPFRDLFDVFEDWLLSFNARKFIKETIEGFYKITLYRDEIANILATKSSEESQKFIFEKTGLLMLTEIKEQHPHGSS